MSVAKRKKASQQICDRLLALRETAMAEVVFVYVSYLNEVATHDLIEQFLDVGKTVIVPKIVSPTRIIAVEIKGLDELKQGEHGILEPPGERQYRGPIDVCITPGLAFTTSGDRLGFGRGYYDRFLYRFFYTISIALAFECQIVEDISTDKNDRAMGLIVTEKRVIRGHG